MHATTDDFEAIDIRRMFRDGRKPTMVLLWNHPVSIESTTPNFGGVRYWFACPACGRRCAQLYLSGDRREAACRVCQKLSYASQSETPFDRALRRCAKIRRRLGWPPGIANGEGDRPPGMHRSTFTALIGEHQRLVTKINASAVAIVEQLRSSRARTGGCCPTL